MTHSNSGTLQKHYDRLAPRERLALICAAIARGDDAERRALIDSAPVHSYRMPDYHGEADAFNLICLFHIAKQLDLAYLQATLASTDPKGKKDQERLYHACCMSAYVYCTRADAWRAFCEELGIDAGAALKGLPGADSLLLAGNVARRIAFTEQEAQAYLGQGGERLPTGGELLTVESATAELRAIFERWAAKL